MLNIKSISIPQPCHQSWQQMELKEQGRYCAACAKTVIDFSKMTNDEILSYLSGSKNVCGRFNEYQLLGINYQLKLEKTASSFNWKSWLVAAGLLGAGFFNKAAAQPAAAIAVQQPVSKAYPSGKAARRQTQSKHQHKKIKTPPAKISDITDDKTDLVAYRADISVDSEKFNTLPKTVVCIDVNASTELIGMVGGVSISGYEIYTPYQSRVEMFYQYMPWPINRLFK